MIRFEHNGRKYVHGSMGQRRGTKLGRQMLAILGKPAIRVLGQVMSVWSEMEGKTGDTMVMLEAFRQILPEDQMDDLIELFASDKVDDLVMSIVHGVTVDGLAIDVGDEESVDRAYGEDIDPWALHIVAVKLATEYRLFPMPGGSQSDTGDSERAEEE